MKSHLSTYRIGRWRVGVYWNVPYFAARLFVHWMEGRRVYGLWQWGRCYDVCMDETYRGFVCGPLSVEHTATRSRCR